jgi:hypothetical protein
VQKSNIGRILHYEVYRFINFVLFFYILGFFTYSKQRDRHQSRFSYSITLVLYLVVYSTSHLNKRRNGSNFGILYTIMKIKYRYFI